MMYRSIIITLIAFVLAQTAARNYFDDIRDGTFRRSCKTSDDMVGECVPYEECSRYNSVVTDENDTIDIRAQDGPCPSSLDVCCLLDDVILNMVDPEPIRGEWCGWRNPQGIGYQTTGDSNHVAKFGEFPWTVFVTKMEPLVQNDPSTSYRKLYLGGGSLIHPSVALTAAHIVLGALPLLVRAGEWDTQTQKEVYPHQDRKVKEVVVHKDFNRGNLFYDITLLFLENPMIMAPNVGVVCLAPPGLRAEAGSKCFASGWWTDKFGKDGQYKVIMKKVEVPVVDRKVCQNSLRNTRLGRYFELHKSLMCAGGEPGVNNCRGDDGSPLVCPIEDETDRYMQSGIVAWGIGCGQDGAPGVYVDVAELREWVDTEVVNRGLSTDFYTFE